MTGRNGSMQNVEYTALLSSVKVGAASGVISRSPAISLYITNLASIGAAGLVYGGISGVVRSPHPVIHSLSCGIHWFACGTSFWWLRSNILRLHYEDKASSQQRAYVSALSGGIAGGGVTRIMGGRLLPGVVVFSLLGYLGQSTYNAIDSWQMEQANTPSKPIMQRIADSKWIPLRNLSDDEYRGILNEKLLSIEAEMALIDEKIEQLEKAKLDAPESTKE